MTTPLGVCFDGRDLVDAEDDACASWATTTIPRAIWAPLATVEQYPPDVPCCDVHAEEVRAHQDAAAAHAEAMIYV